MQKNFFLSWISFLSLFIIKNEINKIFKVINSLWLYHKLLRFDIYRIVYVNWNLYWPCVQLGDPLGQATAQMNVSDLRKALGLPAGELSPDSEQLVASFTQPSPGPALRRYRVRRESMEQLQLIKVALRLFACSRCYPNFLLYLICVCGGV